MPKVLRDQGAVLPQVEKLGFQGSEVVDTEVVTRTCQKVIYKCGGPPQTTYICP